ncbi:MAG: AAA family ATPase [Tannerella sp.]|jgi:predicted ATPase|nr:AAA family ATPase [Tannerella sp.]
MEYFLTNIKVNKVFHLEGFDIPIDDKVRKHLVITGRNGSGKTVLLNALLEFLENILKDKSLYFISFKKSLEQDIGNLKRAEERGDNLEIVKTKNRIKSYQERLNSVYGKIIPSFNDIYALSESFHKGDFIIAYYGVEHQTVMIEPKTVEKPNLTPVAQISQKKTDQFLKFLLDCKTQEAFYRMEHKDEEAEKIAVWFNSFEDLLCQIFGDEKLELKFNPQNYAFEIEQEGKEPFKFTQLAAGYSAIMDIVSDLILKMQTTDSLTKAYDKQGIVLIDEIDAHLHLELQRMILPILTKIFPRIQFVVTTHSPFVLNSLPNIVAFDLEHRRPITDLTDYSYEALVEGYFGAETTSNDIELRLERLEKLMNRGTLSASEKEEKTYLMEDFDKIPEALAPSIKAKYLELRTRKADDTGKKN